MLKHLLCTMAFAAVGGVYSASLADSFRVRDYSQLRSLYANDVFNGTDRYLTQYIRLSYSRAFRLNQHRLPVQYSYSLQQDVYTPSSIFADTVQKNDRPYSSVLFATINRCAFYNDRNLTWSLEGGLGIIGRHGYGEDMQHAIHSATGNRQAIGWKYQVKDAPYVQLQTRADKEITRLTNLDIVIQGQVRAGTVFNDLCFGQLARIHLKDPYFTFQNKTFIRSFRISAEFRNDIRFVAYNGTLQGAIGSQNNPYTIKQQKISSVVLSQQITIAAAWKRFSMRIAQNYISAELITGLKHRWMHFEFCYLIR